MTGAGGAGAFVAGLIQTATDAEAGIETTLTALAMIGVSVLFANGSFKGHAWVRTFYLFGTPLLMATEVVLGENMLSRPGFSWPLFGLQAVVYAVFAWFLTRPRARDFFASRPYS